MGNGIQVIDAAISAVGPNRFIFRLFGQEMSVFIIIGSGTANDATPMAAMGGQPPRAVSNSAWVSPLILAAPENRPSLKL